jgi:hypothetical protein
MLRRTGYGFKQADVDNVNVTNAVNTILKVNPTPPKPPVNSITTIHQMSNLPMELIGQMTRYLLEYY